MPRPLVSALWLVLTAMGLASQADACAVCGFGRDGTTSAYLMTAALMSTVPLVMGGAIVYYLFRQAKHDQRNRQDRSA